MAGNLRPGDIVKVTRTIEVLAAGLDSFQGRDVRGGAHVHVELPLRGSLTFDMVKRAVRKPKVGDVVTARQVYDTKWKRGTVLSSVAAPNWLLVLTADGEWFAPCAKDATFFSFEDFLRLEAADLNTYKVEYLP